MHLKCLFTCPSEGSLEKLQLWKGRNDFKCENKPLEGDFKWAGTEYGSQCLRKVDLENNT